MTLYRRKFWHFSTRFENRKSTINLSRKCSKIRAKKFANYGTNCKDRKFWGRWKWSDFCKIPKILLAKNLRNLRKKLRIMGFFQIKLGEIRILFGGVFRIIIGNFRVPKPKNCHLWGQKAPKRPQKGQNPPKISQKKLQNPPIINFRGLKASKNPQIRKSLGI